MKQLLILIILLMVNIPVFAESVDTAWVRRYDGSENSVDEANSITVDTSGNIYVTGVSNGDYATIKYDPHGDTAWVRKYNGPGNDYDYASDVVVDGSGNVYVTGYSMGSGTSWDYATIKYYPNGDTAWVRRYSAPDYYDKAFAIAVDGFGNVYVTGYSHSGWEGYDYATIKYYPNGELVWVKRYDGPGNEPGHQRDIALAVAVDSSGSVYVTGESDGGGTSMDYATIKYYPNGDVAWVKRYNGPGNGYDKALAIAVDSSGNVCVTGYSYGSGTDYDYATIKYYPNGDTTWVRRYNGPVNSYDYVYAMAVDGSGNVYVTGESCRYGTSMDFATIKYFPNGDTAWMRRYNGIGNSNDHAYAIAVDSSGNVYVTGNSVYSGTSNDYATIKYFLNGDTAWVRGYDGQSNGNDYAVDIAVDGFGNVYVTGNSDGSGTSTDYATIKYFQFLCGDVDKDGVVDAGDMVYLINYLFNNGPLPVPILKAGDASCNGVVDVEDVVYLINYILKNGPDPCC